MTDFSWTQSCSIYDHRTGSSHVTTLDAVPGHYAGLSAEDKTRASISITDPIDLKDGRGLITEIEGDQVERPTDLFDQHRATLSG